MRRRKSILFGAFSEKIKKEDKVRLWKEVFNIAQSFGLFGGKEWTYVRDVYWPNVKKGTMVSINQKQTRYRVSEMNLNLNNVCAYDHMVEV